MRVEPSAEAPLVTSMLVQASAAGATSPAETARAGRNFEKGRIMAADATRATVNATFLNTPCIPPHRAGGRAEGGQNPTTA